MNTIKTLESGQEFVTKSTTVRSIRKSISKDGETFVGIDTADDDSFAVRLSSVQRALSVQIGYDDLKYLRKAEIEYRVTNRVAGQEFVFRPSDEVAFEADTDGKLVDILFIEPTERHLDKIDAMPAFVSRPKEEVVKDEVIDEEPPKGAILVDDVKAEPEEAKAEPKASSGKKGSK